LGSVADVGNDDYMTAGGQPGNRVVAAGIAKGAHSKCGQGDGGVGQGFAVTGVFDEAVQGGGIEYLWHENRQQEDIQKLSS